jgi:hypothetical protein
MGSGFRTFASGEVLTSDNVQNYLMDQAVMVFAGTAARGSALPSPETGMTAYSTATGLQVYDGNDWVDVSTGYGVATGGSSSDPITVGGVAYTMLTFTADSNLVVSKAGLFDCLLVGGGAGAGANGDSNLFGGGGGGGGVTEQTIFLEAATYALDVAAGGALFVDGLSTRISASLTSLTATGGGRGGGRLINSSRPGSGGCGGGGIGQSDFNTGGLGNQGFAGGNGVATVGQAAGGGGGGSAVGANGSGTVGGDGGAGFDASAFRGETANTTRYAGGGGGGGASGGTGGSGGGGNRTVAGSANTGGGGGGNNATGSNNGAAGGSGIALIRFKV